VPEKFDAVVLISDYATRKNDAGIARSDRVMYATPGVGNGRSPEHHPSEVIPATSAFSSM
jgi:hypothetical protein